MVLSMERWSGKVAVVTGASSGIGAVIAEALVISGLRVVGVARRKERIDELSKKLQKNGTGKLYAVKADVSIESEIIESFKWIEKNVGPISILINNAGMVNDNTLIGGDTTKWRQTIDVNVIGLSVATREAIEQMKRHNIDGHVIHLNSILGHHVYNMPNVNMYPATKFAITALTETLRLELNRIGSRIKISSISPGIVDTEIFYENNYASDDFKTVLHESPKLQPTDVADALIYILSTPPHAQVHDLIIKCVGEPL